MFQIAAGDELYIGDKTYSICRHPSAPDLPYGQEGRQAIVYELEGAGSNWALKVFKPYYRRPYLVRVTRKIAGYSNLPGMEVCNRTIISTKDNLGLLKVHPGLMYSALMPWIEGPTWTEVLLSRKRLSAKASLGIAQQLLKCLVALEEYGLSHGDLSGSNIMLPVFAGGDGVSLVDVEQMYSPGAERPEVLPEGSPGYGFPHVTQPLWGPFTDRYPGSIILAEVLSLCDGRAVEGAWGESFFTEDETGRQVDRLSIMMEVLQDRWGDQIASIFQRNWFAETPEDCTPFAEWLIHLPETAEERDEARRPEPEADTLVEKPRAVRLENTYDIETVLTRAREQASRGDTTGAVELYGYILQTTTLPGDFRAQITSELEDVRRRTENVGAALLSKAASAAAAPAVSGSVPRSYEAKRRFRLKMILIPAIVLLLVAMFGFALWASLGRNEAASEISVPDLTGMTQEEAKSKAEEVGLKFKAEEKVDNNAEKGKVLEQEPAASKKIKKGETVTAVIATKDQVSIPGVLGAPQDDALAVLQEASLNCRVIMEGTQDQARNGIIIGQEPAGGSTVDVGTSIELFVGVYQPVEQAATPSQPEATPQTTWKTCPTCGGGGFITKTRSVPVQERCPVCDGDGMTPTGPCTNCGGTGVITTTRTETYSETCPTCGGSGRVLSRLIDALPLTVPCFLVFTGLFYNAAKRRKRYWV